MAIPINFLTALSCITPNSNMLLPIFLGLLVVGIPWIAARNGLGRLVRPPEIRVAANAGRGRNGGLLPGRIADRDTLDLVAAPPGLPDGSSDDGTSG